MLCSFINPSINSLVVYIQLSNINTPPYLSVSLSFSLSLRWGQAWRPSLRKLAPNSPFFSVLAKDATASRISTSSWTRRPFPAGCRSRLLHLMSSSRRIMLLPFPMMMTLSSFLTFIQTTVYGIDVGKVKESPRVKEIRARLLHCEV